MRDDFFLISFFLLNVDNIFDKLLVTCGQLKMCKKPVNCVYNFFYYPQGYLHRSALVHTAFTSVLNFSTAPNTNTTKNIKKMMCKGARI